MNKKQSLKINSVIYMVRNIMNIIFPLITFKYAALTINANGIGAVNYSSAIVSYFGLIAQLGINTFAISEGSKCRNNKIAFQNFTNSMFTLNLLSTFIAYIFLFLTILFASSLYEYRILIVIYSFTIIATTISMEWLFIILERFAYITIRSVIFQIISIVLLFIFVKSENDVIWYAILSVFASSASSILNLCYANRLIRIKFVKISNIYQYIKPVFVIWISNVASLIYINADTILLGILKGNYEVGIYSAATKIVKAVCVPITTVCTVSAPSLAANISKKDNEVNQLAHSVINFMSFFIFPSLLFTYLLAKEAILFLSGPEFLDGLEATRILDIDILLSPLNGFLVNQILIPAKKERISMYAMIIAAIFNIVFDILLIPILGINGAAIATVLSELIVLVVCIKHVSKVLDLYTVFSDTYIFLFSSFIIIPIWYVFTLLNINYIIRCLLTVMTSAFFYYLFIRLFKLNINKK